MAPWVSNSAIELALLLGGADRCVWITSPKSAAPSSPRQHILTIEGENNVTFVPAAGLNPFKVEYRARIEYLVKTRTGKELEDTSCCHSRQEEDAKQGDADGRQGQEERRR